MVALPDIEAIWRRIDRVHRTLWESACVYVMPDGSVEVLRSGERKLKAEAMESAGCLVGAYTSEIPFDQLAEDVRWHCEQLKRNSVGEAGADEGQGISE